MSTLADGDDRIKVRLEAAAEVLLVPLKDNELPSALVARFRALEQRLTRAGTFAATVRAMSAEEASRVAEEILGMLLEVERAGS